MIIKWRMGSLGGIGIARVECTRETEKSVFIRDARGNERREAKKSTWYSLFDTWEEAHAALVEKAKKDVASADRHLRLTKDSLARIEAMQKPE